MNVVYAYFVSHPSELRHDVRDNFEEYITGVLEQRGGEDSLTPDDRPIIEQAAGMMDQLALMEEMMATNTFTDIIQKKGIEAETDEETDGDEPPPTWIEAQPQTPQTPPAYPTYRLD